jgi:hypothetical protein
MKKALLGLAKAGITPQRVGEYKNTEKILLFNLKYLYSKRAGISAE